ncbi:hypothetical protein Tco_1219927 [Tanacetum coccineum]
MIAPSEGRVNPAKMGTNSSIEVKPADASSMIVSSVPITSIVDLDTTSRNKTIEVKVYRIWVSTSVTNSTPIIMFAAFLIDKRKCTVARFAGSLSAEGTVKYANGTWPALYPDLGVPFTRGNQPVYNAGTNILTLVL